MEQPQRYIVRRKGNVEQMAPGTEPQMLMYLATSQAAAIQYGASVFGCEPSQIEAVVA